MRVLEYLITVAIGLTVAWYVGTAVVEPIVSTFETTGERIAAPFR